MTRRHQCPPTIDLFHGSGIFLESTQDDADEGAMLDIFESRIGEVGQLTRDALALSSGTIASLTGQRDMDELTAVQTAFIEFCRGRDQSEPWQAAWNVWRANLVAQRLLDAGFDLDRALLIQTSRYEEDFYPHPSGLGRSLSVINWHHDSRVTYTVTGVPGSFDDMDDALAAFESRWMGIDQ